MYLPSNLPTEESYEKNWETYDPVVIRPQVNEGMVTLKQFIYSSGSVSISHYDQHISLNTNR